jgi:hypothetical protein
MAALSREESEAGFICTCIRRLQELVGDTNRIFSSELLPWLPTSGSRYHNQKPDLIVLHPAFLHTKILTKGQRYCLWPSCGDEVKPFDFKLQDPNAAFGKLVIHQIPSQLFV